MGQDMQPKRGPRSDSAARSGSRDESAGPIPAVSSRELLRGGSELRIEHGGELYRLRRTRLGKLILTK